MEDGIPAGFQGQRFDPVVVAGDKGRQASAPFRHFKTRLLQQGLYWFRLCRRTGPERFEQADQFHRAGKSVVIRVGLVAGKRRHFQQQDAAGAQFPANTLQQLALCRPTAGPDAYVDKIEDLVNPRVQKISLYELYLLPVLNDNK